MSDAINDVERENENSEYNIKRLANILRRNRLAYLEYTEAKNILKRLGINVKEAGNTVEIWKKI